MVAFSIMAVVFLGFAISTNQLATAFDESYSTAALDAVRIEGLTATLRTDEQDSVAAYGGSGDLTIGGAAFDRADYPSLGDGALWTSADAFLTDLTSFQLSAHGFTVSRVADTGTRKCSWLLFLGPGGQLISFYRFVNVNGNGGYTTSVDRFAYTGTPTMHRVFVGSAFTPNYTVASPMRSVPLAGASSDTLSHAVAIVLPLTYNDAQLLVDNPSATLEGRYAQPRSLSVRPLFQP